jgi:uncharacterized protein YwgA
LVSFLSNFVKLGTEASVYTFDSRIKLQKLVYLSDSFGIPLGFNFTWYVYGPYSPQLTKIMFDKETGDSNEINKISKVEKVISKLKEFLGDDIHSGDKLELIASLHYICTFYKNNPNKFKEFLNHVKSHPSEIGILRIFRN